MTGPITPQRSRVCCVLSPGLDAEPYTNTLFCWLYRTFVMHPTVLPDSRAHMLHKLRPFRQR